MTAIRLLTLRLLGILSTVVFVILVIDVLWGVFTRYALGHQAPWSEEIARLLLVWLSMLGTALAYATKGHLGVDTLHQIVTPEARRYAEITTHLLVLIFAAGPMFWGGLTLFLERMDAGQVMATMPLRKAWVYLSIPVSGFVISIFAVLALVETVRRRDAPAHDAQPDGA
jgi:TRAP-type C4-dicarboxylate transport system permease small subunit